MESSREADESSKTLERTIQEFNATISHFTDSVGVFPTEGITFLASTYILIDTAVLAARLKAEDISPCRFLVPYERDEQFVNRDDVMSQLRNIICEVSPENNHRVALYGIEGVGKTQIALSYVYTYRTSYERIYWINAADETSLFSGFQEINQLENCVATDEMGMDELAKAVLAWLRCQKTWLVVLDDLDDIELVDGYLPDASGHTLITTRNPDVNEIEARGVEVPPLNSDESIKMLYALSELSPDSENKEAEKIVKELDLIPVAIAQVAAYVCNVSKSLAVFLNEHEIRRVEVQKSNKGKNIQDADFMAITCSLSSAFIKKHHPNSAKLLQLFAFLNPDLILLEFIQAGSRALADDIKELLSDPVALAEALINLEKFVLVHQFLHQFLLF